jgi:hypothetical protein
MLRGWYCDERLIISIARKKSISLPMQNVGSSHDGVEREI